MRLTSNMVRKVYDLKLSENCIIKVDNKNPYELACGSR